MNYQHKYKISFGHKGLADHKVIEVYAFDIKSAIDVALHSMQDEVKVLPITSVEAVKQ